jgi:hypothetical protein
MSKSIVGIAKSTSQVETTLADLQNNGLVPAGDISLLMPDSGPGSGDKPELGEYIHWIGASVAFALPAAIVMQGAAGLRRLAHSLLPA